MTDASPSRGALIVFEGLDRSGKSTQSQLLRSQLAAGGHSVLLWRFPDRTSATGKAIDAYLASGSDLADAAIHHLFSANRWEKAATLESALASGTSVICDRYAYSGAAFTAAKRAQGLDLDWCKAPDRGLPAADAVVFLSVSAAVAARRGGYGAERYEKAEFQAAVAAQFAVLQDDAWTIIDAGGSVEAVQAEVTKAAQGAIERCRAGVPIRRLWQCLS